MIPGTVAGLRALPEREPPRDRWPSIRSRLRRIQISERGRVAAGGLLAACTAGLALLALGPPGGGEAVRPGEPAAAVELSQLTAQSQYLERVLRGLPGQPALARADTTGAVVELEDRIAVVDERLNTGQPGGDELGLWRERVDLMGRLVRARHVISGAEPF